MTLNRLNVTRACDSCKTLKVKCDNETPKCTQCIKKKQECTYYKGKESKRGRKPKNPKPIKTFHKLNDKEDNELFRDLFPEAIDYLNNTVMEDNESLRKTLAREQLTIFRSSTLQPSSFGNFMSYRG
ncbi:fungal specific transcription factor [Gigaspora margarita]|uniref:Fungal specific transcription factor n=1 Tax=Gigaspora margarita TaxID=4874 RepID=A0A8H4ANT8_GIGMA|nr:fungal specific transcription factor [Gigaspora margarita]